MNKNKSAGKHPLHAKAVSVLLPVLLAVWAAMAPFSWIGHVLGWPVRNLFSDEGIRWFYTHLHESFTTPLFAVVLPVALLCGAVERSGLWRLLQNFCRGTGRDGMTYRQRMALRIAGVFVVLYFVPVLVLVLSPQAVLLNAEGHICPSPFSAGILPVAVAGVQAAAMIYAALSNHLRGMGEVCSVLYFGLQRYAVWIFLTMLAAQMLRTAAYIFNFQ